MWHSIVRRRTGHIGRLTATFGMLGLLVVPACGGEAEIRVQEAAPDSDRLLPSVAHFEATLDRSESHPGERRTQHVTCRVRSTSDWSATVEETVGLASTPIPLITTTELTRTGDAVVTTMHNVVDLTTIPADIRKRFVDEVGSDWPARVDELIANGTLKATDVVSTEKAIDGVHDAPPYCAELSGVFMSAENVPGRPATGGLREFQFAEATVSVGAGDVPVAIRGPGYEAKITAWAAG